MLIIPFIVLTILQYAAAADKRHLQSSMNMDIPAVAWDVSTYVEGTTPTFFTAAEVMDNTDDNNILSEFIRGFGALSNKAFEEIFGKKKKKGLAAKRLRRPMMPRGRRRSTTVETLRVSSSSLTLAW